MVDAARRLQQSLGGGASSAGGVQVCGLADWLVHGPGKASQGACIPQATSLRLGVPPAPAPSDVLQGLERPPWLTSQGL